MRTVIYIHGAFASGLSFQRIKENLPKHVSHTPEYAVDQPMEEVIAKIDQLVNEIGDDVHLVAHSLGGIAATAVAQRNSLVKSVLTMSTPFGGSRIADSLRWFSAHELYQTLNSNSLLLRDIQRTAVPCRMHSIITTVGNNPMMYEANDGVVSLKSQLALPKTVNNTEVQKTKVALNHFEVLLSNTSIKLIKEFTFS